MSTSNQPDAGIDPSLISEAIDRTKRFIEQNGIDTYDPFDVLGTSLGQKVIAKRTPLTFLGRMPLWFGMLHAPIFIRKLLGTKKRAAAGGVASLAAFYTCQGSEEDLRTSRAHLEWLVEHATRKDGYIGWGFPYPWLHKTHLPAGTPIGHTTMTCGNAFLRYYEATGDAWAIEPLLALCLFFDRGLNKTELSAESAAVSYTPTDHTQVINVQADLGSLLFRVGSKLEKPEFGDLGLKLIQCVLENQNQDGSWYYSTFASVGKATFIDNHHTGMVLSSLSEVHAALPEGDPRRPRLEEAVNLGTRYFLEHLFTPEGLPKFYHDAIYPLDIYNFAQSIVTLLDIRKIVEQDPALHSAAELMLQRVLNQLFKLMYKTEGGFLYRRTRFQKQDLRSLRWADALTAFALTRYLQERPLTKAASHA